VEGLNKTTQFVTATSEVDVKHFGRDVAKMKDEASADKTLTAHERRMFNLAVIAANSSLRMERLLTSLIRENDLRGFGE